MRKVKSRGFTLIEVIVSIAILAVIVTAFSGMFLSSIKTIAKSGNRSNGDYEAQRVMEEKISNPLSGSEGNIDTTVESTNISIIINSREITVPGKVIKTEFNDGRTEVLLTTFVPD